MAPRELTRRKRRGRPLKYETWHLAALCALKALLNLTFKRTAEIAPFIVRASPSPATIHRAWILLKNWAMEVAAKIAGNPDLLVADSIGIPHRRKGRHFKVHFLYDIRSDIVMAAAATPGPTADIQGYRALLKFVPEGSVVLADAAYFGRGSWRRPWREMPFCSPGRGGRHAGGGGGGGARGTRGSSRHSGTSTGTGAKESASARG